MCVLPVQNLKPCLEKKLFTFLSSAKEEHTASESSNKKYVHKLMGPKIYNLITSFSGRIPSLLVHIP